MRMVDFSLSNISISDRFKTLRSGGFVRYTLNWRGFPGEPLTVYTYIGNSANGWFGVGWYRDDKGPYERASLATGGAIVMSRTIGNPNIPGPLLIKVEVRGRNNRFVGTHISNVREEEWFDPAFVTDTPEMEWTPDMAPVPAPEPEPEPEPEPATIEGLVTDVDKTAVLFFAQVTDGVNIAYTDAHGKYSMLIPASVTIPITVSAPGYITNDFRVETPESGAKTVDFALEPEPIPEPEPVPEPEPELSWFEKMKDQATGLLKDLLNWVGTTELELIKNAIYLFTGREYKDVEIADALKIIWENIPLVNALMVLTLGKNTDGEEQTELSVGDYLETGLAFLTLGAASKFRFLAKLVSAKGDKQAVKTTMDIYENFIAAGKADKAKDFAKVSWMSVGSPTVLKTALASAAGLFSVGVLALWWYLDNLPFYGHLAKEAGLLPADIADKIRNKSAAFSKAYEAMTYAKTGESAEIHYQEALGILDDWNEDLEAHKEIDPNFWQGLYQTFTGEEFSSQYAFWKQETDRASILLNTAWQDKKTEFDIVDKVTIFIATDPLADSVAVNGVALTYEFGKFTGLVASGMLEIKVRKEGYEPIDVSIYKGPGETFTADYKLVEIIERAYVQITANVGNVEVYQNNQFIGFTDTAGKLNFYLPADTYVLKFEKSGYDQVLEPVVLTEGQTKTLTITMNPISISPDKGVLEVNSSPAGVDIYLAGEKIGTTDLSGTYKAEVSPFTGDMTFRRDGYLDRTKSVSVWSNRTTTVNITLTPIEPVKEVWRLDISAQDAAGNTLHPKILVNGSFTDRWAPDYILLDPGTYTIRLELSGYAPWEQSITLE